MFKNNSWRYALHSFKLLLITVPFLFSLYGCTDKHVPANCPPDCPEGITTLSVEETDRYMMGEWQVFTRQIEEAHATELQGTITIDKKISPGLYGGSLEGEVRFMKFDWRTWECAEPLLPNTISCRDDELIERANIKVTLGMSTDGIELVLGFKNGDVSVFMDVHENYIGRTLGPKLMAGEEIYMMGKIKDGKSALDSMDTSIIKMD
jgi:hypothetical protein